MREHTQEQCPEDKLQMYSYLEELGSSRRRLTPLTPLKQPKWVADPWEQHLPLSYTEPRPPKSSRKEHKGTSTPEPNKSRLNSLQKENKTMKVLPCVRKNQRQNAEEEVSGPYKVAIASVLYPLERRPRMALHRRIDRFHSFVARSIRK